MAPKTDEVATDHADTRRELNKQADNLDTVEQRIEQARRHARPLEPDEAQRLV